MTWTICFDIPGIDDPLFCAATRDGIGFSTSLAGAMRFDSEETAWRILGNSFTTDTRQLGVVVEIGK